MATLALAQEVISEEKVIPAYSLRRDSFYVRGSGANVASIHCSNFSVLQGQGSLYHSSSRVSPSLVSLGNETSSRTGIFVISRTLLSDAKKALRCLDLKFSVGVRSKSLTPFTTFGLSKDESDRILVS